MRPGAADPVRRPDRQDGLGLHLASSPRRTQPQKDSYKPFKQLHRRQGRSTRAPRSSRPSSSSASRPATRRTSPSSRSPVCSRPLVATPARSSRRRKAVADNVDKWFGEDWKDYGTVDGKFYAAPLGANVKSFVWYSPKMFKDKGWTVPTTLGRAASTLSDKIAATGIKPWCAGIGSGDATGWPVTDWIEDVHAPRPPGRTSTTSGSTTRSRSTTRGRRRRSTRSATILKNAKYVNGGFGDVKTIATTTFQDGGLPILEGKCALHRQASFYAANWPKGTDGRRGRRRLRVLPAAANDDYGKPVLGGGEFVTAFSDRPEVQAFQTYLSTDAWANAKAKATPPAAGSAPTRASTSTNLTSPIDKLVGRDPAGPERGLPLRRLRPDAGCRRRRLLLEGDDRLDHRARARRTPSTTSRTSWPTS